MRQEFSTSPTFWCLFTQSNSLWWLSIFSLQLPCLYQYRFFCLFAFYKLLYPPYKCIILTWELSLLPWCVEVLHTHSTFSFSGLILKNNVPYSIVPGDSILPWTGLLIQKVILININTASTKRRNWQYVLSNQNTSGQGYLEYNCVYVIIKATFWAYSSWLISWYCTYQPRELIWLHFDVRALFTSFQFTVCF